MIEVFVMYPLSNTAYESPSQNWKDDRLQQLCIRSFKDNYFVFSVVDVATGPIILVTGM